VEKVDFYINNQLTTHRSIFRLLRNIIQESIPQIEERWSFKLPYFYFEGKPLCYFHVNKSGVAYLGINRSSQLAHLYPELQGDGTIIRHLYFLNAGEIKPEVVKSILYDTLPLLNQKIPR
jgi:hypothetical protein